MAILDDQQKKPNAASKKKKRSTSRFGRRLRDRSGNNQKTPRKATVSVLPSSINIDEKDMDTISTLSSRTDRAFNLKRRLDSSKQQVILLKKKTRNSMSRLAC